MNRLNEQQVKQILFNAQCAGYPNKNVPEILAPLYTYVEQIEAELARQKQWVKDLQSGMYVNCVYCGHRYGPADKVPVSMADVLKQHIEQCPEHPMSKLKAELEFYKKALEALRDVDIVIRQEEWGAVKSKPTLKSVKRFAGEVLDQAKVEI